jgi:hypothetical protein
MKRHRVSISQEFAAYSVDNDQDQLPLSDHWRPGFCSLDASNCPPDLDRSEVIVALAGIGTAVVAPALTKQGPERIRTTSTSPDSTI